jgi:hypothetical protein
MADEAVKMKQQLVQKSSPSSGPQDKDKVNRLAKMIKKLSQLKTEFKQAETPEGKSEAKQKVVAFTQKWLDEKLLQLVE